MRQLLVDTPTGEQDLITLGDGGSYFDPSRVLWDDSVDGPIPQEGFVLGGMVREGDALAFSAERKAAHDAALAAVAAAQVAATEQARIEWGARMGLSETQTARLFALVN